MGPQTTCHFLHRCVGTWNFEKLALGRMADRSSPAYCGSLYWFCADQKNFWRAAIYFQPVALAAHSGICSTGWEPDDGIHTPLAVCCLVPGISCEPLETSRVGFLLHRPHRRHRVFYQTNCHWDLDRD